MIIREELNYQDTFIRGEIINFEEGYTKHGTFLKIDDNIVDCGFIEINTKEGATFKFIAMEEEINEHDLMYGLNDLLEAKPRTFYAMSKEQEKELEEAKKKRCEGKFEEALKLHIKYCYNNMGKVNGEIFEEVYILMVAMGYYDLALCFMGLAVLSEKQTYAQIDKSNCREKKFDELKELVRLVPFGETNKVERVKYRNLVKKICDGNIVQYRSGLVDRLVFKLEKIEKIVEEDMFALKLAWWSEQIWFTKELIDDALEDMDIYIENIKVEPVEGSRYRQFLSIYLRLTNPKN